ncbi:MAG TPA: hypothetical protein VHG93_07290 [Longimicrobium sp.]|nr:hypothetical protein [Longimicrobium sp.]
MPAEHPVSATEEAPVIDRDNPWPGLVSFPEAAERFFNGRDAERDDLLRRIGRETLTLLYGLSGLGKSSLLRAGLFPVLRHEHFLPVYVRLDHAETSPPHDDQLRRALLAECAERRVEAPAPREGESAWELLHRADGGFWDARNYPVTPVLVIDQFEEIFTLGMTTPARQARSRRFMAELGDLIDNRPPDALVRRLDADPDAAAGYAFSRAGCKIVISMREDFLPELGRLRDHTRSTFQNYLRLLRMRGDTAVDAIVRTGGELVDRTVARAIVCFLAKIPPERQPSIDLAEVEVEPALLSLVCRELNERRREAGLRKIEIGLLDTAQTEILTRFYRESFAGMKPGVRVFVEEELLTETGYRDAAAVDDAMRLPDISPEVIDALVARRLIRKEERFGTPRIELTHDVLTDVVRDSRDRRRAEEEAAERRAREHAQRARRMRATAVTALVMITVLGGVAAVAWSQARHQASLAEMAQLNAQEQMRRANELSASYTALARAQSELERSNRTLELQRDTMEAQRNEMRVKRDSLATVVEQMQAARSLAGLREQEAMVGAEAADYYLDVSGRLLRRRVAEAAALDSTAGRTVARAQVILDSARVLQGQSARMDALVNALCAPMPKEDRRNGLRAAVDSILGEQPLCAGRLREVRSASTQAGPP